MNFFKRLLNKFLIRIGYVEKKEVEQLLQTLITFQKVYNEKMTDVLQHQSDSIKNLKNRVLSIENYLTEPDLAPEEVVKDKKRLESSNHTIDLYISDPLEGQTEENLIEEKKKLN